MNLNKIYSSITNDNRDEIISIIEELIRDRKHEEVNNLIDSLSQIEIADVIVLIDFGLLETFIKLIDNKLSCRMIPNVDDERSFVMFETLGAPRFAELINQFEDHEFSDFLHHHQDLEEYESLYENLNTKKQVIFDRFYSYPEDSAGRLMQSAILYASMEWTIRQVKDFIKSSPIYSTQIERIFLIDTNKKIQGSISLSRLLKTNSDVVAKDIMNDRFVVVKFNETQKKIVQLFQRYSLEYVLVVNSEGLVLGAITADDVVDVLEIQVDQNFMRSQYLVSGDHMIQNRNFFSSVSIRLPWLVINIFLSTLVSSFVALFTDLFTKHIELTVVIPIIASISSISGAQTIATTIHTLAKSDIKVKDILKTFSHEIIVSISVAVLISILSSTMIYFRFGKKISTVYLLAMFLDFCVASLSGIFIPLLTYFVFKWDPAIISPILVTTISDFAAYLFSIILAIMLLQ